MMSIFLPVMGVWIGPQVPDIPPYLALASLILLVMDAALFDRIQKDRLKRGAKLQEQFDTDIFGLPWNRFVTGAPVELEDVRRLTATPLSLSVEASVE
jgi:SMODS-associating 4TM effector domain